MGVCVTDVAIISYATATVPATWRGVGGGGGGVGWGGWSSARVSVIRGGAMPRASYPTQKPHCHDDLVSKTVRSIFKQIYFLLYQ